MTIAKMNRVFLVGVAAHKEETLRFLQRAGVLHLEPVVPLAGDAEKETSAALARLRQISQIEQAVGRYRNHTKKLAVDCSDEMLVSYTEETLASFQETQNRRQVLERLVDDLAPWGDFDPEELNHLEKNGVTVQRWRMEHKKSAELNVPDGILIEIISEKPVFLFYTISLEGPIDICGASLLKPPEMRLSSARREIERLQALEESLVTRLAGCADAADVLNAQMKAALTEASYLVQKGTLYSEEYLFGLQGWIPVDQTAEFLEQVKAKRLSLLVEIRDPLPEEEPPILLKNNWLIRRIEPLLKLYGIPKYHDLDPAYFFAPFMILFFGLCLSDAGYGVVFYLVAHFIGRKWGGKVEGLPLVIKLCKAFAVSAVIIGLITGSVFGYNFEDRRWILLDVAPGTGNPMLYFYIALGLGVVHLTLSYLLGMAQSIDRYSLLQKLGILFVLWGGVMLLVRNIWFPAPSAAWIFNGGVVILAMGILLILLFASNHPNWFIRLGIGLWNVYGLSGLVGDLLSYARLFGLGIATGAIAAVMNQLAVMIFNAAGPIIGIPLALIVILLGHTFNLALSILGSTIHSARLHFVEAFKSFFEGGGVEYKPFKIERGKL